MSFHVGSSDTSDLPIEKWHVPINKETERGDGMRWQSAVFMGNVNIPVKEPFSFCSVIKSQVQLTAVTMLTQSCTVSRSEEKVICKINTSA